MKGGDSQVESAGRRNSGKLNRPSSTAVSALGTTSRTRPLSVQTIGRPLPAGPGSIDKTAKTRSATGPLKAIHVASKANSSARSTSVNRIRAAGGSLDGSRDFNESEGRQERPTFRSSAIRAEHVRSSSLCSMPKLNVIKSDAAVRSERPGFSISRPLAPRLNGSIGTKSNSGRDLMYRSNNAGVSSSSSSSTSELNNSISIDAKNNNHAMSPAKSMHISSAALPPAYSSARDRRLAYRRSSLSGNFRDRYEQPGNSSLSGRTNGYAVSPTDGRASVRDCNGRLVANVVNGHHNGGINDDDDDDDGVNDVTTNLRRASLSNGSSKSLRSSPKYRENGTSGDSPVRISNEMGSSPVSNGKSCNNNADRDRVSVRRSELRDREGNMIRSPSRHQYVDRAHSNVLTSNLRHLIGSGNRGFTGLNNLGNTCFMNSILQCLSNTAPLLEYCLTGNYKDDINKTTSRMKGAMITAYAKLMESMWLTSGHGAVAPSDFKSQISRFSRRFVGYSEQDAHELLVYLLEGLHEDINRVKEKRQRRLDCSDEVETISASDKASLSWKEYVQCENSRIVDIFGGQLKSALTCLKCGYVSNTFEPFFELSLPIKRSSSVISSEVSLRDCFDMFTQEETLSGDDRPTCARCRSRQKCIKRFSIQRFPHILIIHLKRFNQGIHIRTKLKTEVNCPMNGLELGKFSSDDVRATATYSLYAVSNHSGTPMSGHYTAHAKHPISNSWHYFNDSRVTPESLSKVSSSDAYLLFYERQG